MTDVNQLVRFLEESLDDGKVSRGERGVLTQLLDDLRPSSSEQGVLLNEAFRLARSRMVDARDQATLDWLYDVVKVLRPAKGLKVSGSRVAEAWFMPGEEGLQRLLQLIAGCRESLDVCVFTITDNRIADALVDAHRRGVKVRILTDDEKAFDRGSDVDRLRREGVPLRTDDSASHMHNKFAIFDGERLLTGSYNWTRSATRENQENFLVTDDPALVTQYSEELERLWEKFG
jgi:cardiolipin hydrolase